MLAHFPVTAIPSSGGRRDWGQRMKRQPRSTFVKTLFVIAVNLCGFSHNASAQTVFSNLGPGDSFSQFGDFIFDRFSGIPDTDIAVAFIPEFDSSLGSIDLALTFPGNVGSPAIVQVTLMDGDGDTPNQVLETLLLTLNAPATGLFTLSSIVKPVLRSGVQYWLAVSVTTPSPNGTVIWWLWNSVGDLGLRAWRPGIDSPWSTWGSGVRYAFRVNAPAIPHFTYVGAGDSVAAGQDIDGAPSDNKPFAYPKLVGDALCSEPPPGIASCNEIVSKNIAISGNNTSDFLERQFPEIRRQQPDLVTTTIGIDGIMMPAVECLVDAEKRFHFLSDIRTSAYISAVAASAGGCLTGLFLSIEDYLDSVHTGLATIRSGLLGLTPANVVFTTYYNPIKTTGVWGYVGRTFADFIGPVNSFIGLQVVQNPARLALADLGPAFVGHEMGTTCSYIERLNNLPLLPFGVHPNKLGQKVIAGIVLKAARDKGFISGSSSPVATCVTGQVRPGQIATLSGVDLQPGMTASIQGVRADVIGVSRNGFSATLRIPNVIFVGVGNQVDVTIKNPNGHAKTFRVDVVPPDSNQ
jgi:hypothetical protein